MKRQVGMILYRKPILLLCLFAFIAYLPVFLPFFHLKNDLLNQNLPTRFIFSESLYSGFEPYWNPYINYGIPQYGDMNSGFWNPFKWLIGSTFGYNIYSITIEEWIYIVIGGFGMYKVILEFFPKNIALLTALTYMACGYMTGHLQYFCWITGTAFFPYVLLFFIRVNKMPILKNFAAGAISVFFFVSSTHPGLIIGALYFIASLLLIIYFNRKKATLSLYHRNFVGINIIFILVSTIVSILIIVSNIEVLSFISRGSKVSLEQSLMAPTTIQSYISLFYPLPVHKSSLFQTDIAMRNVYVGIAHFLGLFLLTRIDKKIIISFLIPLIFFVLLAAGGMFKTFSWRFIPLLGYVRLNGEFTYFVMLILLFGGAAGLTHYIRHGSLERPLRRLLIFSVVTAITVLCAIIITKSSLLFSDNLNTTNFKTAIKSLIDQSTFLDLFIIQALLQSLTLYIILKRLNRPGKIALTLSINLVLITWMTIPFTGLGLNSKKEIQSVINTFEKGIKNQELRSINKTNYIDSGHYSQFLLISSFSKKIGYLLPDQYPVQLQSSITMMEDSLLYEFIKEQAYIFLSNDTIKGSATNFDTLNIKVIRSGPGYYSFKVNPGSYQWLTLMQNNYLHWKVYINGNARKHYTGFKTFISIPITRDDHTVEIVFEPYSIKIFMWISLGLLIICLCIVLLPSICNRKVFT